MRNLAQARATHLPNARHTENLPRPENIPGVLSVGPRVWHHLPERTCEELAECYEKSLRGHVPRDPFGKGGLDAKLARRAVNKLHELGTEICCNIS